MVDPNKDWISLHRNLLINELWKSEPFTKGQAWVDLLMMANWQDGVAIVKGIKVDYKRGQLCRSMKQLALRWKWSEGKVKRYLELLSDLEQISFENWSKNGAQDGAQKNALTTLITITNYGFYQPDRAQNKAQTERKQCADGAQTATDEEVKKLEVKKDPTPTGRRSSEEVLVECFTERKERIQELFPMHDFEVVKETCIAFYRSQAPPADPYVLILNWFKREQTSRPTSFNKPRPKRGLTDDFEKAFLGADEEVKHAVS
jgi:hypothetical protein